jgi:hypothetical protein
MPMKDVSSRGIGFVDMVGSCKQKATQDIVIIAKMVDFLLIDLICQLKKSLS